MTQKRKNLKKKIASISALGAGVLVLGAEKADAGIIYSGAVNAHVGFGAGGHFSYSSPGLGASSAFFSFYRSNSSFGSFNSRRIVAYGCGCLQLAEQLGMLQLFDKGQAWTPGLTPGTYMNVGGGFWGFSTYRSSSSSSGSGRSFTVTNTFAYRTGNQPFSNKYALFEFESGPQTLYGWVQLSFTVNPQYGPSSAFGPDLIVQDWAFDDSGAVIAAGDTTSTPEPGTAASTGLAALALGAAGLRRWRQARKAA